MATLTIKPPYPGAKQLWVAINTDTMPLQFGSSRVTYTSNPNEAAQFTTLADAQLCLTALRHLYLQHSAKLEVDP